MASHRSLVAICLVGVLAVASACACRQAPGCRTAEARWRWDPDRTGVQGSTASVPRQSPYGIELRGPDWGRFLRSLPWKDSPGAHETRERYEVYDVEVRSHATQRVVYGFPAHAGTSFTLVGNQLYWLHFDPGTSLCQGHVVGVDLGTGTETWRTPLRQPCVSNHSHWLTEAWLEVDAGRVVVYVREQGRPSARVCFDAVSGEPQAVRRFAITPRPWKACRRGAPRACMDSR